MADIVKRKKLEGKELIFCQEYIKDFNATRAVLAAGYKNKTYDGQKSFGWALLQKDHIKKEIARKLADIEESAQISKLMVILEHKKIAFSSIAHLHDTWMEKKAFDLLPDEVKSSIAEISTQIKKFAGEEDGEEIEIEFVKVRLYDKQRSLDSISKMMGYDAPTKIDLTSGGLPLEPPKIVVFNTAPPLAGAEDVIDI